jgi:hypothetical protein
MLMKRLPVNLRTILDGQIGGRPVDIVNAGINVFPFTADCASVTHYLFKKERPARK